MICRCAGHFLKVLLKFKMAATDQFQFFGGRKNSKKLFGQFFFNFNITFLATCGCAIYLYIIGTHSNNVLLWFTKQILDFVSL